MNASPSISIFAPAKLNLFLAVTGRRPDGFHDLVSLVSPIAFGDTLRLEPQAGGTDSLECDAPGVPTDGSNLVLKAAAAWRAAGGAVPAVRFILTKKTPSGAGMGGGSSDAVAALQGLQRLATTRLPADALMAVAASLGSDCPLFLAGGASIMRGRGERLEVLDEAAARRLRGRRVLVCHPGFGVETPWAYGRLAAGAPETYSAAEDAEGRLAAWRRGAIELEELLENSFERVVFAKFLALPALAERLRTLCGLRLHLTGSGSACFALLPDGDDGNAAEREIRAAWGAGAFSAVSVL